MAKPRPPMTERKAREIVKLERIEAQIAPKDAMVMRLNRILEAGLKQQETLWFSRGQARIDFRAKMEAHPMEFNAQQRSFSMMMNKALPTKLEHTVVTENKGVTPDQLEQAGLTMEQIRQLAFPSEQAQITDGTDDAA